MNDELQLDSLIKKMASEHAAELPSPGLIWWRAQILRKQEEKQRIERPMMIMRFVAMAVCALIFIIVQGMVSQENWWFIALGVVAGAIVVTASLALLLLPSKS
jgi:hypothetical protein